MLKKITDFLDQKLSMPMARLAEWRYLRAVRDGIIATLPLIIVGSFFLIVAFPPLPKSLEITQFLTKNIATILLPYRMTMYIMTLYAVFGIGSSLAKSYKLDGLSGGILAEMAFLLTIVPVNITTEGAPIKGMVIPMGNLGAAGMFVGILVSIFAVEVYRFCDRSGFKIKMPEQIPASVARSFEALTPTVLVVLVMSTITYFIGFDLHKVVGKVMQPLISGTDTLPSVLFIVFMITFFWSFGIHGVSVVGSIIRPLWLALLEKNTVALASGQGLPATAAEPFYQWFIWIGGSGCTIGLTLLLLLRAKSIYAKSLGRTSILPAIFNINEPIIFGAPIVLNPILIIPFILTPMVCAVIAWIVTNLGLVNRVSVIAPWTLPGPIGAYLATNGDYRAIILNIVLILLSMAIYYPFFRMYDKNLLAEEKAEMAE
ncbi:PTS sugar transporter subunit IIC [Oceanivirga salmonicida]|uniref:PTS sugar transporter subunit IIC n=1 Tax=Oceanivirga salmonicida TaxID=1769291 RepID=UPI00082C718B|nr:PTS transporter subunit EIIC [Oceanivirga salmonicida]